MTFICGMHGLCQLHKIVEALHAKWWSRLSVELVQPECHVVWRPMTWLPVLVRSVAQSVSACKQWYVLVPFQTLHRSSFVVVKSDWQSSQQFVRAD